MPAAHPSPPDSVPWAIQLKQVIYKIYAVTDQQGRPVVLALTASQVSDFIPAQVCLEAALQAAAVIADRGYNSDELRGFIKQRGAKPVIPPRRTGRRNTVTTRPFIKPAVTSSDSSAVSRTSAAWRPVTTVSPIRLWLLSCLLPQLLSGYKS